MAELLCPRHSLDKYHQAQLKFLKALPEAQRAYLARLSRLGNASYRYQQQAEGAVTEDDFRHWLAGLPEQMRLAMERDGFEASQKGLPLRRHTRARPEPRCVLTSHPLARGLGLPAGIGASNSPAQ